ncbi:MAG: hypothetical protein J1F28_00495 [Oscillospiraceae bacterium]|nr:hypothetical protein [Oscillospiraceae bacterium]
MENQETNEKSLEHLEMEAFEDWFWKTYESTKNLSSEQFLDYYDYEFP